MSEPVTMSIPTPELSGADEREEPLPGGSDAAAATLDDYRQLVALNSDAVWRYEIDSQGRFVSSYVAPVIDRLLRLPPGTIDHSFERFYSYVLAEDLPALLAAFLDGLRAAPGHAEADYRVRRGDGEIRWFHSRGRARRLANGHVAGYGTTSDITARRAAESALRQSEARLRALFAAMPDIIMCFDREARHTFVSENVRRVVPMPASMFLGRTHRQLGFPEHLCELWESCIARVFETGDPCETEFALETPEGEVVFDWRLAPELGPDGTVDSVIAVSRDITEHRRAERSYRTLFERMRDGFALHEARRDEAGELIGCRILSANEAFLRLFDLGEEEVVGRTLAEVAPDAADQLLACYRVAARTGEPALLERSVGRRLDRVEITAYEAAPGQLACIFRDCTERLRAETEREALEAQLRQAHKMESVGRLAGGVAHDFNNMLSVILGHAEMAEARLVQAGAAEEARAGLEQIRLAAERSAELTRQLLAFARKQAVAPRLLDLNDAIEGLLQMLRRLIGEDIALLWRPGDDLPGVLIDPAQLHQVLTNLCVNARDSIDGTGTVLVATSRATVGADQSAASPGLQAGDYVLLTVRDDGSGMDGETLDMLFEPFFTTKEVGRGTGLGLATVYGIVKQNEGYIGVESEPGRGTTFRIYLPQRERPTEEPELEVPSDSPAPGGGTILLVEDELPLLELITSMLECQGYEVLPASGPSDALRIARACDRPIDLLVTDMVMPEMNGRELSVRLAALRPELRALFISGYTSDAIARRGGAAEGVCFLQKPFTVAELATAVAEALAQEPLARGDRGGSGE